MNRKHGRWNTPTWKSWACMINRCERPQHEQYPRYGGRGILICARWHDFENFLADIGERPSNDHSIERIDNDGNYEPGNCRWANRFEQARNRRNSRFLVIDGQQKLIVEWLELSGVSRSLFEARKRLGWADKEAVFTPAEKRKPFSRWKARA
jgi:hypothetical protein